jgi:N-formylglutamate deformylase
MNPPDFQLTQGQTPLLISMPHNGSAIPPELQARMTPEGRSSRDTDWFLERLYAFASELGIGVLQPHWSRYVIDLNRPPDDTSLYPGQDTTGLCPLERFDRAPIWLPGQAPDQAEVAERVRRYWQPYHSALRAELERLHSRFGRVLLFEAHSIASRVPRFFAGTLPELNFGSADGQSCAPQLTTELLALAGGYSAVLNGRFKGGYITRAYHARAQRRWTLQLELSQATYLDEATLAWEPARAAQIQMLLRQLLTHMLDWLASTD